jgi:hypothetical protein
MSASSTGDKRAMTILRELHAAEEELVGRAAVLTDGKAGTIDGVFLDDVHGLSADVPRRWRPGELHPFQRSSNSGRPIQALLRHRVAQPSCGFPRSRA